MIDELSNTELRELMHFNNLGTMLVVFLIL